MHHVQHNARRGTAMMELVLILPMIMLVLALLFFFGKVMVRTQQAQVMSRYEVWRDVANAPGPSSGSDANQHPQLNNTFFDGQAASLQWYHHGGWYPREVRMELVELAAQYSSEAEETAQSLMFVPFAEGARQPHGHHEGFIVDYDTGVPLWRTLSSEFRRQFWMMNNDWRHTIDWRASADQWINGVSINVRYRIGRSMRDVYFSEFDEELDNIDGDYDPEYADYPEGPQQYSNNILAGFIRSFYLSDPSYRGPIVYDERP